MNRWIGQLSNIGAICAGTGIVGMVLLILVEVVTRRVFNASIYIAQEYTAYLMVLFVFTSLAYLLKRKRHIKITMIRSRLSQNLQRYLDVFIPVLALALIVYLTFWSFDMAIASLKRGEIALTVSMTPLFIPKFFIPTGLILFALQLIALIAEGIKKFKVAGS